MTAERWRRVKHVFQTAVDQPPEERAGFLALETTGDDELRREVENMLRHSSGAGPLDRPAWEGLRVEPRLPAGALLGPYEILMEAGAGGMGRVYKARDARLGRIVAIKVLKAEFSDRLRDEARAISALNHPNVCALYDIGEQDGAGYLVMEYIEGESLASALARGPLPLDVVARYGMQIAGALATAHTLGIVHRDLKPANIMIMTGGVKVLDFGIARMKDEGEDARREVSGTAAYMSPSRWIGGPADARSDVYALGLVLYEMAAGIRGEGLRLLPQLPASLARLIESCVREEGGKRVQRMDDVREALERFSAELSSRPVRVSGRWHGAARWAAAMVAVAVAGGMAVWKAPPEPARDQPAAREAIVGPSAPAPAPPKSEQRESEPAAPPAVTVAPKLPEPVPDLPLTPPALTTLAAYPGQERDPAFSPDGLQVAFSWQQPKRGGYGVWVRNLADGNPPHPLIEEAGRDWGPAWSPDGRRIAFERRTGPWGIYWAPSQGGVAHLVSEIAQQRDDTLPQISWSRDGRWIAAPDHDQSGVTQIFLFNAETGERRQLTTVTGSAHAPAFSPDGRSLAYAACSRGNVACDVYVADWNGDLSLKPERQVTAMRTYLRGIAWLPDGRSLVFSAGQGPGAVEAGLWHAPVRPVGMPERIDLAGSNARHPSIAPIGERLAFTRVGSWNLMVINGFR
jgi:serine/threonine protein kinase